jgi:hypothetical protein
MRKSISATILVLLLACSARADWMANGAPAPPPTANAVQGSSATPAEPVATDEDTTGAADTLTQVVLTVLVSLLP